MKINIFIALLSIALFLLMPYAIYGDTDNLDHSIHSYDTGIDMVKKAISSNNFPQAELILRNMLKKYPYNHELLSILARVLFWQKRYDESIEVFNRALQLKPDESLKEELEKVRIAKILNESSHLLEKGNIKEAKERFAELFETKKEEYESGYNIGMIYIKEREYEKAMEMFKYLQSKFPDDIGFKALYIESLILNRDLKRAKNELFSLTEEERNYLSIKRPDLFYRVKKNYLKVSGSWYDFVEEGRSSEHETSLEISQRINNFTFVLNSLYATRYGLHDKQITIDVYSNIGEKSKRWGFLSLSISPDAEFLPKTSFGGEIYQAYENSEVFLGYRHMSFKDTSVDILMPGIIIYLPYNLSLNERLYLVPKNGGYSLLSTLHYEPNHKIRAFYSIAIGKAVDRISVLQDIQKISTITNRVGLELRISPDLSIGSEFYHEFRENMYTKYGLTIFSRIWW